MDVIDEQANCGSVGWPGCCIPSRLGQKQEAMVGTIRRVGCRECRVVGALGEGGCSWDEGDEDGLLGRADLRKSGSAQGHVRAAAYGSKTAEGRGKATRNCGSKKLDKESTPGASHYYQGTRTRSR